MTQQALDWKGKSRSGVVLSVVGSVVVLPANGNRIGAVIANDGVTIKYLVKGDLAAVNTGIPLVPNGSYEIHYLNPWKGPIAVYCANAGENITWVEDE